MTFTITLRSFGTLSQQTLRDIIERIRRDLPSRVERIEPHGIGCVQYTLTPYTGTEPRPENPVSYRADLSLALSDAEREEKRAREIGRHILYDINETMLREWSDARYIRDLAKAVKAASGLWRDYWRTSRALEDAYAYLRTSAAAGEWRSAISRLIDAQDRALAAARAFDERARDIAQVHDDNVYSDLTHLEALTRAGYPAAAEWDVAPVSEYGPWSPPRSPLEEKVRQLIEQQDAHLAKVARLSAPLVAVPQQRG